MALIRLCVVLESWGSPFFRARRVGRYNRPINVLKFRKMHCGASGRPLTLDDDDRFTKFGGFLARTKLDELPQLLNVVRGDMSLVGPRPEDLRFVECYSREFEPILAARPGMTGLSQLAFLAESRILDPNDPIRHYQDRILPQKLELDTLYVTRWRPLLDLRIVWWTLVSTVLFMPVSVDRSTARMGLRTGTGGRRRTAPAHAHRDVIKVQRAPAETADLQRDAQGVPVAAASIASIASNLSGARSERVL